MRTTRRGTTTPMTIHVSESEDATFSTALNKHQQSNRLTFGALPIQDSVNVFPWELLFSQSAAFFNLSNVAQRGHSRSAKMPWTRYPRMMAALWTSRRFSRLAVWTAGILWPFWPSTKYTISTGLSAPSSRLTLNTWQRRNQATSCLLNQDLNIYIKKSWFMDVDASQNVLRSLGFGKTSDRFLQTFNLTPSWEKEHS